MIEFECRDVMDGLQSLKKSAVDLFVTSPPYNLGKDYGVCKDSLPHDEYLNWVYRWSRLSREALKDTGSFFLNISGKPSELWLPFDVAEQFRCAGWKLQNVIHWVKSIAIGEQTLGHYKPINSGRYLNDAHEYLFHFSKTGETPLNRTAIGVPYQDKSNLDRWKNAHSEGVHCRGNVWFIPYRTRQSRGIHPAEFPVELPEWSIRLQQKTSDEALVVCDPFCGTGATALAAARCNCHCIGFDLNETYLQEAKRRLQSLYE